mmetsp:Transcript_12416/g.18537  ORF Transcript_12416/g.18537 Transcript_12416/m.18537 type:complete len:471 (+) Transcript_12416:123-1535(+)
MSRALPFFAVLALSISSRMSFRENTRSSTQRSILDHVFRRQCGKHGQKTESNTEIRRILKDRFRSVRKTESFAKKDMYDLFGDDDESQVTQENAGFQAPSELSEELKKALEEEEKKTADTEDKADLDPENSLFVLSRAEAENILSLKTDSARKSKVNPDQTFTFDIGKSEFTSVEAAMEGVWCEYRPGFYRFEQQAKLETKVFIPWKSLSIMSKKGKHNAYQCFNDGRKPRKISIFSKTTKRPLTLMPSEDFNPNGEGLAMNLKKKNMERDSEKLKENMTPPTLVIGGFTMHRIKNADPMLDTREKILSFPRGTLKGDALDICTGLGYTAIELAKQQGIENVVTLELDKSVLDICRSNPWSRELFSSYKIERRIGNAVEVVRDWPSESLNVICHDPPAQALTFAGDLYSQEFYDNLYRILKKGGVLFHYVGNPESKESGSLFSGIMRRLQTAGFRNVRKSPRAFGINAEK